MKKYYNYFRYLVRHKYYVFVAGLKVKASIFRLVIHDWSKFLPSEWFPYMEYFYGKHFSEDDAQRYSKNFGYYPVFDTQDYWNKRFKQAWLFHQHRNKHHWQYWCLRNDDGITEYLDIPDVFVREMIADWAGAGKAITGKWEVKEWYSKNKEKIKLSENTRRRVEELLEKF